MKVLAIASEPISARQLRAATGSPDVADVEVMVVAPALHESALRFWLSDADEAIANARRVANASVEALEADGVTAAGEVGESELVPAIRDALATFAADRVLLFTHRPDESRYREDEDPDALSERLGVSVERIEIEPTTTDGRGPAGYEDG